MPKIYLSVVIPAYNEEKNFLAGLVNPALKYLQQQKYNWELLFVDDGSTDSTFKLLAGFAKKDARIRVLKIPHGGKAAAVTAGVLDAKGEFVLFTDFDQSTPINHAADFLNEHNRGNAVVIGVRGGGEKVKNDTLIRKIRSWGFLKFVQIIALPGIKDSQCGFKSFTATSARKIFTSLKVSGSKNIAGGYMGAFDVEVLYLARKYGFRIAQLPVNWIKVPSEKLNVWKEPLMMLRDTCKVRIYDILGLYEKKSRHKGIA